MTTYVLSQHPGHWHIARYDGAEADTNVQPMIDSKSEEDALASILERAQDERPSQVIRIALSGESRIVAKFDA